MKQAYDIVAVGVAAVDDLLYVPAYPEKNTKAAISRKARHPGGLATTAAAAACRLGGTAAYVARFGDTELAGYMTGTLREFGVDVSHVVKDAGAEPYHSTIVVDEAGSRTILYDCSKFRAVEADDVSAELIGAAKVFFLDYIQDPPPVALARKVRELGHGKVAVLGDIEGRSESVRPLLPLIDHLIVSEEFGRWASGVEELAGACAKLAEAGRAATVVTAGAAGCYVAEGKRAPLHVPAFAVAAVDTTGCGDTFHGAFALGVARGFTVRESALFASAAAALKATGRGGWQALPTAAEMAGFLRGRLGSADAGLLKKVSQLMPGEP